MFSVTLMWIISFSFLKDGHDLEYAGCEPLQFEHFVVVLLQSSEE